MEPVDFSKMTDEQLKGQFTLKAWYEVEGNVQPLYEVENVTYADNKLIIAIKQNSLRE